MVYLPQLFKAASSMLKDLVRCRVEAVGELEMLSTGGNFISLISSCRLQHKEIRKHSKIIIPTTMRRLINRHKECLLRVVSMGIYYLQIT